MFLGYSKYAWSFSGFEFVDTIINSYFTSKYSFYMRKFNILTYAIIGYACGYKKEDYQFTQNDA